MSYCVIYYLFLLDCELKIVVSGLVDSEAVRQCMGLSDMIFGIIGVMVEGVSFRYPYSDFGVSLMSSFRRIYFIYLCA